jgi:hypothetical protein
LKFEFFMSEVPAPLISTNRLLGVAGSLGGTFWIALAFAPLLRMTETREGEVFWNRLWTLALLGMLLGFLGLMLAQRSALTRTARAGFIVLLVGFALMMLANSVEYWMLSDLPHQGPDGFIRGIAWMTFLVGTLAMQLASAIVGFNWLKSHQSPRWQGVPFLLLLPTTIAVGCVSLHWAGIPLGIASIAVGGSAAWASPEWPSKNPLSN